MTERIHVLVERAEKERFRRAAARQGISLSEWLRLAAEEKLVESEVARELDSPEALKSFFDASDEREQGREPDWEVHRELIERSRTTGGAET
jgi:hypothetical protein